jgi:MFS transporter, DHA1 family, multidrug resistance protein
MSADSARPNTGGTQWRTVIHRPALPIAVFLNLFAWAFSTVTLPFYAKLLPVHDPTSTTRWTGWILGITPLLAICSTPLWIRFTRRWHPRTAFILADVLQGLALVLLPLVREVLYVFIMRAVLGLSGPANTFAFLIAGRSGRAGVQREVAAMQSAINLGLIIGPLAGSLAAAHLGYGPTFIVSAVLLWGSALAVRFAEPLTPALPISRTPAERSFKDVSAVCLLVLVGYVQVFFLNAIFPNVLAPLGVATDRMLPMAGWILFGTGAMLTLAPLAAPSLSEGFGEVPVVVGGLAASSLLLVLLGFATGVWGFAGLWMLHVATIAPAFSLVTARVARWTSGQALGLVNVFRVLATFLGPVAATTLLSWWSPPAVFAILGTSGLVSLLFVGSAWKRMSTAR